MVRVSPPTRDLTATSHVKLVDSRLLARPPSCCVLPGSSAEQLRKSLQEVLASRVLSASRGGYRSPDSGAANGALPGDGVGHCVSPLLAQGPNEPRRCRLCGACRACSGCV